MSGDAVRQFASLMRADDDQINLAEASLLIARTEYPDLDVAAQLRRLDALAEGALADPSFPPLANIQALNELLFEKVGLGGNEDEYDDPRNSFLNEVLDRKKGLPITLSVIYMEVARRHGLPVVGVGFPGHFLVKYLTGSGEFLLDPYRRGAFVSGEEAAERLKLQFGPEAELRPAHLATATTKQILARMLNNLKGSYFRRKNYGRVLMMIELALAVDPGSRQEVRDRGMVYFLLNRYEEARADFNAYLSLSPGEGPDTEEVRKALHRIRSLYN
jgi:regulator of sirC expression with transglutaminase-like and TPR domain